MEVNLNLFDLASQQARWLSVRQAAIAGNIANANTTGYLAVDVEPFSKVLDATSVGIKATQAGHIRGAGEAEGIAIRAEDDPAVMPSGNTVQLEEQLLKAGEVRRSFELNTAIVKAFHRMMMMTSRA
ncbi:MAG TPA: flagellar basal body rod protein FlgB [Rhizobiaceae bacterium]|nr:flagellar basal body rod protein FlgB [Rhizobiaceae bacterium]